MSANREFYEKQGRALYGAGLIIFFGAPRSWQHAAKIRGYKAAQTEWKAAHSSGDEWKAATARNREFCISAIGGQS